MTGLDELGLRIMETSSPTAVGSPPASATATAGELDEMYARLEELAAQMQLFTHGMRSGLETLSDVSSRMSSGLAESIGAVSGTVEELGRNLQSVSEALAGSISGLSARVAASEGHVQAGLSGLGEAIDRNHRQSSAAIAGMEEANQRLAAALASTADRVAGASDRLQAGVESQSAVQQAVQELSASVSDLGARLAAFRQAQDALAPALNRLAGPLELRLMPSSDPGGGTPPAGASPG